VQGVTLRQDNTRLVERATLSIRPSIEYSATRTTAELADIKLTTGPGDSLSGRATAQLTPGNPKPTVAFTADLQGKVVTALKPFLAADTGPLGLVLNAEGQLTGDTLEVAKATARINRDAGPLIASVDLRQPLTANLQTKTVSAAKPDATAVHVQLAELPLQWAAAFVPKSNLSGSVVGGAIDVSIRSMTDLTATTTEPFRVRGATVALDGKPFVQALDATVDFTATKRGDAITYEVRQLELRQAGTSLATLKVTGTAQLGAKLAVAAKGNLDADLGALLQQPVAAPYATLSRGKLTTTFDASMGNAIQAKATIAAHGLVARQNNQPLGDADLTLTATVQPDGTSVLTMPLTLKNGPRASDVSIDGKLARNGATWSFTGKIASQQLFLQDFQPLAALAPASPSSPAAAPSPATPARPTANAPSATTPDTQPFWHAVQGRADVDLKSVQFSQDYTITGITGAATIAETRLALENLSGKIKDNAFKVTGEIGFQRGQPAPYKLSGSADLGGIAIGEILRVANPNEKPAIESTIAVKGKLDGTGATLPDLVQRVYGQFDISGGKGTLRALGRKGEAVGLASTALGIFGAIQGSDTTVALGQLGRELDEMAFDSFAMHVDRAADLNLNVTKMEFLSPSKRVTGTGKVTYKAGAPINQWPFDFTVSIAGKDYMAQLLNRLHALSGQPDENGYYPMAFSFPVSGTLTKVQNGLWPLLAKTAAGAALGGFLGK
jgi:hypothetical protein